jgi:hypothetical protein
LSILKPNNIHDVNMILPLFDQVRKVRELQNQYLVADLGYLGADSQKKALHENDMAVIMEFKSNTKLPEVVDSHGHPECEMGARPYTGWF